MTTPLRRENAPMTAGPDDDRKMGSTRTSRRHLLAAAGALGSGAIIGLTGTAQARSSRKARRSDPAAELAPLPLTNTGADQLPHKPLGRTGVTLSVIGRGGHHLGEPESVDEAASMVHAAVAKRYAAAEGRKQHGYLQSELRL